MKESSSEIRLEVLVDPDALAHRVADWVFEQARAKEGLFSICLSGGSTPRKLYERLATARYRDTFPWTRTHWFFGDERFVPHDDALSNYRMVREALLSRVPVPPANIHPVQAEGITPQAAATAYENTLKSFYDANKLDPLRPLFDINLLGLGPDGHTASLFPGSTVLSRRDRWVAAVIGVKPEARITLTYPALESSRHAAFLVAGDEKKEIVARLLRSDDSLPATRLRPTGKLWMFCDVAAAPDLG